LPESRLTAPLGLLEKEASRVAAHNSRRLGGRIVITNDAGEVALLSEADYARYLSGTFSDEEPLGKELVDKEFVRDRLDFPRMAERWADRRLMNWGGTNVHTIVLTQRCNFKCVYCHASVVGPDAAGHDMTPEIARRVVDLIFESPSPALMVEFQGGEPLLNWPVLKFIVRYARKKNALAKRLLHFSLISNFSMLDDEKIAWLADNEVTFCTSLDGPADVHNRNRVFLGGNSHAAVLERLGRLAALRKERPKMDPPNAICTVTRHSLGRAREIVDALADAGMERIQLGSLDPIGFAERSWEQIGYTSEEFIAFYEEALDRVIELSRQGRRVYEKGALILLLRVLGKEHWRFPNADGVARLAYNWDGDVYSCEEGRLLANAGDTFFRLGRAGETSHAELLAHPIVRASAMAAAPENQPQCSQCAYSPFCTVFPVYNYQSQRGLWGHMPTNGWCRKMMGFFDIIFDRLQDPASRSVLESWLQYRDR
jgi:His-Xaa-Ser system radical SAM maturase HxsB